MKSRLFYRIGTVLTAAAICLCSNSCVKIDSTIGNNLIPVSQQYDIIHSTVELKDIQLKLTDSLSGYSGSRITIGSIRDEDLGLVKKGCVLTLVPIMDTLDLGNNPVFTSFVCTMVHDTTDVLSEDQRTILQNVYVYELDEKVEESDINSVIKHSSRTVTQGTPVYNGFDSLTFYFDKQFGEKYLTIKQDDLKDIDTYLKKFPGIYIETSDPLVDNGGRINMFGLQMSMNKTNYTIYGNYAELKYNSEYNGTRKDTSALFYFSPSGIYNIDSLIVDVFSKGNPWPQYALNVTNQEDKGRIGKAGERMYVEGGGGIKPVISAAEIKSIMVDAISKYCDPSRAIINKATIRLPYEFPEDYKRMQVYPEIISPTVRLVSDEGQVAYAGLADASSSSENQGSINKSKMVYEPDITYHAQELLKIDDKDIDKYDIWFLIMKNEVVKEDVNSSDQEDETNAYYSQLMMAQYYNQLYGYGGYGGYGMGGYGMGGYGMGYGGYGGYGMGGYGNYMNYMMMAQYANMYSSSSNKEETNLILDTHRIYDAVLYGPDASGDKKPVFEFTFSVPKE